MTPGKTAGPSPKPNLVKFAATEADQKLLRAVEHLLETGSYASFSDLCKAALRLMLLSRSTQTQPDASSDALPKAVEELRQQVQQLSERLTQLEQKQEEPPAVPEVDPLLSRLAPLLEDF